MRFPWRMLALGSVAAMTASLGACGDKGEESNATVSMEKMGDADGTTNDAMTDLDGVQSEGTAMAIEGGNNSSSAASNASAAKTEAANSEVVADQ